MAWSCSQTILFKRTSHHESTRMVCTPRQRCWTAPQCAGQTAASGTPYPPWTHGSSSGSCNNKHSGQYVSTLLFKVGGSGSCTPTPLVPATYRGWKLGLNVSDAVKQPATSTQCTLTRGLLPTPITCDSTCSTENGPAHAGPGKCPMLLVTRHTHAHTHTHTHTHTQHNAHTYTPHGMTHDA